MHYPLIKLIHILSATLMIGTGFGSAFYLYFTYKKGNVGTVRDVLKLVILADTIFTTPSVFLQLITGILLTEMIGLTFSKWFWEVMGISLIVFVLWVRAAFIQLRLRKILEQENEITDKFHREMKIWFYLGIPSFSASMLIYYMMVFKVTF
ncbi:MAG TPA: DUF2269 domain-containing protein [Leptospiraceae bacterium]|nr:DUF2269 domain-containing protein [Leptospiraceae bacterium]HMW06161.1 DUF2269 domain-containing protein [Leptospiraceae bacterium]HMX30711.1 DUF2269 domain-containing protein [Leptospiraceae bacterium]HMY31822.1 DUF2269 domain-containing protein [Leptospiraceae bacterium]HMZ64938.1 DUF2269 domain-containing protein [Leptospiraceae bacterium]